MIRLFRHHRNGRSDGKWLKAGDGEPFLSTRTASAWKRRRTVRARPAGAPGARLSSRTRPGRDDAPDRKVAADGLAVTGQVPGKGVDGLLEDATRPPGKKPVSEDRVKAVTALAMSPPPRRASHWTPPALKAEIGGMVISTVRDIPKGVDWSLTG